MLIQLILATAMVVLTVLVHGVGNTARARGMRIETGVDAEYIHFSVKRAVGILIIALALFTSHSIGFEDTGMARPWRLGGATEGINGMLLIDWSTAFFVARLPK